ncbi:type IV pilin N-terminal domain-containing protein [Haloarchaeobius sp. FL176]|uniref:type IV pilin N-terminal domain-containing protein n=1 Tax=Haloarchaeobius sp. FL176 TaxID=2967129 RepID=UPI00214752EE|nr:type IV pilin N-terminal domain-containing protein [Haloarchaeobius sp. FL176]
MMDLKQLFTDDDAVSPVIGVILMVAITVILAAVIGAFVLNIGGNQETAPQNQFDFQYNSTGNVTVSHGGGGTLDATQLSLGNGWDNASATGPECNLHSTSGLSAGDTIVDNDADDDTRTPCDPGADSGETLEITWTSNSGENSQIVADSTVP